METPDDTGGREGGREGPGEVWKLMPTQIHIHKQNL